MIAVLMPCLFYAILVRAVNCVSKSMHKNCVRPPSVHCGIALRIRICLISRVISPRALKKKVGGFPFAAGPRYRVNSSYSRERVQ